MKGCPVPRRKKDKFDQLISLEREPALEPREAPAAAPFIEPMVIETRKPGRRPERTAARVLGITAALAFAVAVAANMFFATGGTGELPQPAPLAPQGEVPAPASLGKTKSPLTMIPKRILTYETTARHTIPGREKTAAEAMYVTLDMDLEAQISLVVYVRVEAFATADAAARQAEENAGAYPLQAKSLTLNGQTKARSGFAKDSSSLATTWSYARYSTLVKASYRDGVPALVKNRQRFLRRLGEPVAKAVEIYQRTGREFLQAKEAVEPK